MLEIINCNLKLQHKLKSAYALLNNRKVTLKNKNYSIHLLKKIEKENVISIIRLMIKIIIK